MRTRTVLLAVAVLTMGALAIGLPALGDNDKGQVVDVTGLRTHQDLSQATAGPPAPGDQLLIRYDLYDPRDVQPGAEVGSATVVCVFTHSVPQCVATHRIDGTGDIMIQALNPGPDQPVNGAITGGTGKYTNAGGEVHIDFKDGGAEIAVSHRLTWGRG